MIYIRAKDLVVEFPIYGANARELKNAVVRAATGGILAKNAGERVVVRALNKVSFELREGDHLGLFGHNGAGKTTLLHVIAGTYEPMSGSIEVSGRIASMLSITLGMDPEATGYENIFLRAAVMGMKPREIAPLVKEIQEFSELSDYIHMPIRTYSSGMAMRLAFAISTCVNVGIILMDEWLSAGDASFTEKAQQRLRRVLERAKILVLASHNEDLLRKNCNKVLHLDHGEVVGCLEIGAESEMKPTGTLFAAR